MATIEKVKVLKGASPFTTGNYNDSFRGLVLLKNGQRKHCVIKDLNKEQLSNELLASVLARHLGLPVPDTYLGLVLPGTLSVNKFPVSGTKNHLVFVSADVNTPNLAQQIDDHGSLLEHILVDHLKKWVGLAGLYAFDTWIANVDRHQGNLLIDGPNNIWLIDHGHAFTGPTWTANNLDPVADYQNKLNLWLTRHLSSDQKLKRAKEIDTLAPTLSAINLSNAIIESLAEKFLTQTDQAALFNFLSVRTKHVAQKSKHSLGVPSMVA
jgi:hypothetical protein